MKNVVLEIQTGWGLSTKCLGFSTSSLQEIFALDARQATRGAIPCGLNRSYGDSSINSGGYRLRSVSFNSIKIDPTNGLARCGSGVSIRELEYEAHLKGYMPPVVPGTSFVTLGGAFASDVHGKSQSSDGNFCDHVKSISIIDYKGVKRTFLSGSDEFRATAGGMGLTGFIIELEIQLQKVDIPVIYQEETRVYNLNDMFSTLEEFEKRYKYSVAWIDLSGKYAGRGLIAAGRYAKAEEVRNFNLSDYGFKRESKSFKIPFLGTCNFMKSPMIRVFNEIWFRKPLKSGLVSFPKFMHPLDSITNWNKVYGPTGFIQYQFVIPDNRRDTINEILSLLRDNHVSSSLTVLKRFGRNGSGFLSFPISGWTLAMDFAAGSKNLAKVIEELDRLVINSGGRIYLSKDSVCNPEKLRLMYPQLKKWKSVKKRMDPFNFWQSDQSRRLEL